MWENKILRILKLKPWKDIEMQLEAKLALPQQKVDSHLKEIIECHTIRKHLRYKLHNHSHRRNKIDNLRQNIEMGILLKKRTWITIKIWRRHNRQLEIPTHWDLGQVQDSKGCQLSNQPIIDPAQVSHQCKEGNQLEGPPLSNKLIILINFRNQKYSKN